MASIRSLITPSSFTLHSRQLQRRLIPAVRLSSTAPPKPRLLEKPERFNPPSHGRRIKAKPKQYGAPLSDREKEAQKTRRYPHMMPPEGSFMFWFLTNRTIHTYISIGVLFSLIVGIWWQDFQTRNPYKDMLPPNSMFFAHPWQFIRTYWENYNMHTAYNSAQVAEKRKAKVEDVQKRSEYRKAHGLDSGANAGLLGGWTAKSDAETMGPGLRIGDRPDEESPAVIDPSSMLNQEQAHNEEQGQPRKKNKPGLLGISFG